MARKIGGLAALSIATLAIVVATAFAQNPALVPQGSRPFAPPDTPAPPPRATAPAQQPPAQIVPAQPQSTGTQIATPASQGMATIAPAPLLQKPAVPPVVNLQNGLLSIDATNSNLSEVLTAVKRVTGAVIEGGSSATERVVVHLGPGRPSDVISALLNGSRFDYVVLGSTQQPGAVTRIMLSVRQGGDQASTPQAASNVPPPQANNNPEDDGPQVEDTPEQREQDVRGQAEPQSPTAPQQNVFRPPQNPQDAGTQNNDQPRTPQQLFEEIQRMQQQRQQDQQNQPNQPNQQQYPPPPQN